jgi:hypothetical protein
MKYNELAKQDAEMTDAAATAFKGVGLPIFVG